MPDLVNDLLLAFGRPTRISRRRAGLWLGLALSCAPLARATPPVLHQINSTVYQTEHCLFIIDGSVTWSSSTTVYNEIYGPGAVAPYFPRLSGYFDTLMANCPATCFSVCYIANTGDSHVPNYIDNMFKGTGTFSGWLDVGNVSTERRIVP